MMKKLIKKSVAALIAVLMVVSTMPFTAVTALADDASDLQTVCTQFENMFADSSKVYKNVSAAYTAYVNAKKGLEAAEYGASVDFSALKQSLSTAISGMTEWSYTAPNVQIKSNGDSTQTSDYTQRQSNVVYYSGNLVAGSPVLNESNKNDNTKVMETTKKVVFVSTTYTIYAVVKIYHAGQTVFVYDGDEAPAFPVTVQLDRNSDNNPSELAWYGYCTLRSSESNNAGLSFKYPTYWQKTSSGECGNSDLPYIFNSNQTDYTKLRSDTDETRDDGDHSNSNKYYGNVVQFTGTMSDNQYSMTKYPVWETYAYNNNYGDNKKYIKLGGPSGYAATDNITYTDAPLYYINYKVVKDKISSFSKTVYDNLKSGNYTQGGASSAVAALDALTDINVSGYNYANGISSAVAAYTSDAKAAVDAANDALFTEDSIRYTELKTAISNSKANYEAGNADSKYTGKSWTAFKNAYENAVNHMKGLATGSYDSAKAKELADALNSATLVERPTYTFVKNNGDEIPVVADDDSTAYFYAVTAGNIPNTAATEKVSVDGTNHTWKEYSWPTTATDYKFTEIETVKTEAHNIVDGKCADCDYVALDKTAYNKAVDEAMLIFANADGKYTSESVKAYKAVVDEAMNEGNAATTQDAVDVATSKILSAKSLLAKAQVTITFKVQNDDTNTDTTETKTVAWGETVELDSKSNKVSKWTVDVNGTTSVAANAESVYSHVATEDATIIAYVSNEESETVKYSKVVFYGKNNAIVSIKYVPVGTEIDLTDDEYAAPEIPFYEKGVWDKSKIVADGSEISVKASYAPKSETADTCGIWLNGQFVKSYSYDSYVYLFGADKSKKYAMYSDAAYENLITYFDGVDFYSPHIDNLYIKEVSEAERTEATVGFTGSFKTGNTSSFNVKFWLPEGATLVETGVDWNVTMADGRVGSGHDRATKFSQRNEYTYNATFSAAKKTVKFTPYVTYTVGENKTTVYGTSQTVEY